MKKILGISSVFLILGLIVCFVCGFIMPVPVGVPKKFLGLYKILSSFQYFIKFLPSILIFGYVISCSVYFGHNSQGSLDRFSKAMFNRFKIVMISSLICTAILTFGNEFFGVLIKQKQYNIENRSKIVNEYIKVGNNLFSNGYYERAMYYADAALKLDSTSRDAATLKDNADVEINRINNSDYRFKLYEKVSAEMNTVDKVDIDPQQIYNVYQCYQMSQAAYDNGEWFNAHYYADLGLNLASPKDPNLKTLKLLSTNAWNNLTQNYKLAKTEEQLIFDKKYSGYLALVEKDDLKAYYIFRELYQTSRELQRDPDVSFYLKVAENRLKDRYFFVDETVEMTSYENSSDVYFSLTYKDGSKDIVYFKGMKNVAQTGKSIQYVRNLTVKSIARNGELFRTMTVPYAKILPVDVKSMNSTTKMLMGIDDSIDYLPYIMLNSVGRDKPNTEIKPTYTSVDGEVSNTPEYLLLPMPYSDFLLLENSSGNPDFVSIMTLFKLVSIAPLYGFSSEIYAQSLLDRLFYPFFLLILFLLMSIFAWNNRIGGNQLFKMSWVAGFPFMYLISAAVYQLGVFVFKLLNYGILGSYVSIAAAISCAAFLYIFGIIITSLRFVSLRAIS